eukprot:Gb_32310 [translate_table: standard]
MFFSLLVCHLKGILGAVFFGRVFLHFFVFICSWSWFFTPDELPKLENIFLMFAPEMKRILFNTPLFHLTPDRLISALHAPQLFV